jgi:hypothetical protein
MNLEKIYWRNYFIFHNYLKFEFDNTNLNFKKNTRFETKSNSQFTNSTFNETRSS